LRVVRPATAGFAAEPGAAAGAEADVDAGAEAVDWAANSEVSKLPARIPANIASLAFIFRIITFLVLGEEPGSLA
jgi:hypothetical protein